MIGSFPFGKNTPISLGGIRIYLATADPGSLADEANDQVRCRNGAANQADVGRVRKVAGLVSLSLPRTTCAIVGGGGVPEGTLPEPSETERTTTMEIFIGLDVSLASTSVCALGADGNIVNEAKVSSDPASLIEHLRGLTGSVAAVGLEAGPQSQWLHKGLSEAGYETVLMETKRVKSALKSAPVNTDRRDAEGIAHLLRMGWFQPVHCKSVASQEKRALLTSRSALVEGLARLELSLRGILRNFGLKLGRVSKGRWEERVRELTADNAMLSDVVAPILRLRAQMRNELAMMTKRVRCIQRLNRKAASAGGIVAHKVRKVAAMSTRHGTISIALWRWPGGSSAPRAVPVRPRVFLKTIAPGCRTRTRNGIRLKDFSHVYKPQKDHFQNTACRGQGPRPETGMDHLEYP